MQIVKKLLVNSLGCEKRIALLESGKLAEIFYERDSVEVSVSNIYKGTVTRVLPGMNSAFVDIGTGRSAFLFGGDVFDGSQQGGSDDVQKNQTPIEKLLSEGQQIVVQVSKEPLGSKGPRVTMHLTLPGKYLVFMPQYFHIGVSRRIESEEERERLKSIADSWQVKDGGVILRTAAEGVPSDLLAEDLEKLRSLWKQVEKEKLHNPSPSCIYSDLNLPQRILRDLNGETISEVIVDDEKTFKSMESFVQKSPWTNKPNVRIYQDRMPLFDVFGIEVDIGRALLKKVDLPSGGHLVIDQTEALTSIDVNTGRYVGKANATETILKTNLEAVVGTVEQLRIRNIGGIIIVDFIDMEDPMHRERVYKAIVEELKVDRARTNVLQISELGLIEMTRKRTADSLERQLTDFCPLCDGSGRVRSLRTDAYDLLREIRRTVIQTQLQKLSVVIRSDLKSYIDHHLQDLLEGTCKDFQIELEFEISKIKPEQLRQTSYEVLGAE